MSRKRNRGGDTQKMELIRQALDASEKFTRLAKLLLEESSGHNDEGPSTGSGQGGIVGVVKGTYLQAESGQKIDLPHDYLVDSQVVFGDKIRMITEGDISHFKFIERVKRERINAMLVQKDGRLVAIADTGSYEILPEAREAVGAGEGDKVVILLPKGDYRVPFATLIEKGSVSFGSGPSEPAPVSKPTTPKEVPINPAVSSELPSNPLAPSEQPPIAMPEIPLDSTPVAQETPSTAPIQMSTNSTHLPATDPGRNLEDDDLR